MTTKKKVVATTRPSTERRVCMSGGVLSRAGGIYLLLPRGPRDEDEAVVAWGRPDGEQLKVQPLTEQLEIRSLIATRGAWTDTADAIALGVGGEVFLMKGDRVSVEHVRDAEPKQSRRPFLGHMTRLQQVGDALFALGFGGQAYVRALGETWKPVSATRPSIQNYGIRFFGALSTDLGLVLVATHIGEYAANEEELRVANAAGDALRVAELLLANVLPNTPALWLYESERGAWRSLPTPPAKFSVCFATSTDDEHLLFLETGSVLRTRDFSAFEPYLSLPGAPDDVDGDTDRLVLLRANALFECTRGVLSELQPPLPEPVRPLSLSVVDDALAVFAEGAIWMLRDQHWSSLVPRL